MAGAVIPLALSVLLTLPVAWLVNRIVPEAYMDEIFHIPQAQQYCGGDFDAWDPNITTFPGLYLTSLVYKILVYPWMRLVLSAEICTPSFLRSINIVLSLVCVLLFREILLGDDPRKRTRGSSLKALVLAQYPLHWFFTFLYYTDVGSTTAVMAMYLACLRKRYWVSALLSVVAIAFRQTNAVWTAFVLCVGVLQFLEDQPASNEESPDLDPGRKSSNLRRRRGELTNRKNKQHSGQQQNEILAQMQELWCRRSEALRKFCPFLVILLAFFMFVLYNHGIVVGAKEAHKVSPHFSQLLYFALCTAGALFPFHFSITRFLKLARLVRRRPLLAFAITAPSILLSLLSVHYFSLAHPYLLADNRHYAFYFWKDIIRSHWMAKYLLVPLYVYSWWSILYTLLDRKPKATTRSRQDILRVLWPISYFVATSAVLVPAPLVEFRYYTVPFYILALHTLSAVEASSWKLVVLGTGFFAVNFVTMAVFLFRPFNWAHEAGTQRFLW